MYTKDRKGAEKFLKDQGIFSTVLGFDNVGFRYRVNGAEYFLNWDYINSGGNHDYYDLSTHW